jgi:hypothetical protein
MDVSEFGTVIGLEQNSAYTRVLLLGLTPGMRVIQKLVF